MLKRPMEHVQVTAFLLLRQLEPLRRIRWLVRRRVAVQGLLLSGHLHPQQLSGILHPVEVRNWAQEAHS